MKKLPTMRAQQCGVVFHSGDAYEGLRPLERGPQSLGSWDRQPGVCNVTRQLSLDRGQISSPRAGGREGGELNTLQPAIREGHSPAGPKASGAVEAGYRGLGNVAQCLLRVPHLWTLVRWKSLFSEKGLE